MPVIRTQIRGDFVVLVLSLHISWFLSFISLIPNSQWSGPRPLGTEPPGVIANQCKAKVPLCETAKFSMLTVIRQQRIPLRHPCLRQGNRKISSNKHNMQWNPTGRNHLGPLHRLRLRAVSHSWNRKQWDLSTRKQKNSLSYSDL